MTSVTPGTCTSAGGLSVTVTGKGFPLQVDPTFVLKFGNAVAKVTKTNNIQLEAIVPPMDANDTVDTTLQVRAYYNNLTSPLNGGAVFTYSDVNAANISDVSPAVASPVRKQDLYINGTNFGTNCSELEVVLTRETPTFTQYPLNILSCNDTTIVVRLGGGRSGKYRVEVMKKGVGKALGKIFFEYKISFYGVSPSSGSTKGGTELTITGDNFCNDRKDNQVFIGRDNLMCRVTFSNRTHLKCVTNGF